MDSRGQKTPPVPGGVCLLSGCDGGGIIRSMRDRGPLEHLAAEILSLEKSRGIILSSQQIDTYVRESPEDSLTLGVLTMASLGWLNGHWTSDDQFTLENISKPVIQTILQGRTSGDWLLRDLAFAQVIHGKTAMFSPKNIEESHYVADVTFGKSTLFASDLITNGILSLACIKDNPYIHRFINPQVWEYIFKPHSEYLNYFAINEERSELPSNIFLAQEISFINGDYHATLQ